MNTDEELARVKDERDEWEKSCAADMAHYNILAKEHAALTQENHRLRAALKIVAFDYTKDSNGPGRADWFQAIACEALKLKPRLVEELVP